MTFRSPVDSLQGLKLCLLQSSRILAKWMAFPRFRYLFLVLLTTSLKHHYGSAMGDLNANCWTNSYRMPKIGCQCFKSIILISFSSTGGEIKRLLPFGFKFYIPKGKMEFSFGLFLGQLWISWNKVRGFSPASYCSIYKYWKGEKDKKKEEKREKQWEEYEI